MVSGSGKLLVNVEGPVMVLTINRPQVRNALDTETAAELTRALRAFDASDDMLVAVLTGAGRTFLRRRRPQGTRRRP